MTRQIPAPLVSRPVRVVRPRDLADLYVNPSSDLARLERQGVTQRIAHGYYILIPPEWVGGSGWRPTLEAVGIGLAINDYGNDQVALMGPSAARLHGALPRAIAMASVAIPKQRPPLDTRWGQIVFHTRDVGRLDLERVDTELARGYQTTIEQTTLDLSRWAGTWDISMALVAEAITTLAGQADWSLVRHLAIRQHQRAAFIRARWVAHPVVPDAPRLPTRGRVRSLGLQPLGVVPPHEFPMQD